MVPVNSNLSSFGFKEFASNYFKYCTLLNETIGDFESAMKDFVKYRARVPVCGAIILDPDMKKVLLVKGVRSGSSWHYPRGKINQDEPELNCAVREVYEEVGVDISPYINENEYAESWCCQQRIRLYLVHGLPDNVKLAPNTKKEIGSIKWYTLSFIPGWFDKYELPLNKHESSANKLPRATPKERFFVVSRFFPEIKEFIEKKKEQQINSSHRSVKFSNNVDEACDFNNHNSDTKFKFLIDVEDKRSIELSKPIDFKLLFDSKKSSEKSFNDSHMFHSISEGETNKIVSDPMSCHERPPSNPSVQNVDQKHSHEDLPPIVSIQHDHNFFISHNNHTQISPTTTTSVKSDLEDSEIPNMYRHVIDNLPPVVDDNSTTHLPSSLLRKQKKPKAPTHVSSAFSLHNYGAEITNGIVPDWDGVSESYNSHENSPSREGLNSSNALQTLTKQRNVNPSRPLILTPDQDSLNNNPSIKHSIPNNYIYKRKHQIDNSKVHDTNSFKLLHLSIHDVFKKDNNASQKLEDFSGKSPSKKVQKRTTKSSPLQSNPQKIESIISKTPPVKSVITKYSSTNPTVTKIAGAEPSNIKPTPTTEPSDMKPCTVKPVTAKPLIAKPATAKPATVKPATAKPAITKPSKPVTTKPGTAKFSNTKSTTAKSATIKPSTSKSSSTDVASPCDDQSLFSDCPLATTQYPLVPDQSPSYNSRKISSPLKINDQPPLADRNSISNSHEQPIPLPLGLGTELLDICKIMKAYDG